MRTLIADPVRQAWITFVIGLVAVAVLLLAQGSVATIAAMIAVIAVTVNLARLRRATDDEED